MSEPQTDDESEELAQDPSGPRLSVWAPILLTAVVIGGLVWWIQSDGDTVDRRRTTAESPAVTTDVALPPSPASGGAAPTAEVALAPAPAVPVPAAPASAEATPTAAAPAESAPAESAPAGIASPESAPAEAPPVEATPAETAPAAASDAPEPAVDVALTPAVEAPIIVAAPPAEPAPPADPATATPAGAPVASVTEATVAAGAAPADAAPSAPVEAAASPAGEPAILASSASLPTATVSDVPPPTRVDAGGIESAPVSAAPPALTTQPPPMPETMATLSTAAPTEAAASVSARSAPGGDPMPTMRVSAPADVADAPPALPVEAGVAVLPVHRMPMVQPSEASDDGDLQTTEVAAGAEAVVKPDAVVPAETVAPVTIDGGDTEAPTASVTGPQPPIGTLDAGAPVMAEASPGTNAGSAPAAPPAEISPGSPNVGDAKSTDAAVIVAETLDPATLGIIVPPDAIDGTEPPADAAPAGDAPGPVGEAGPVDDEHGAIVAEEVDPASLGLTFDAPGTPADAGASASDEQVVSALPPEETTTAIVAETLDLSALSDSGPAPAAAEAPAEDTVAAAASPPVAESGGGALPMVATVSAIAPPRPAWQRFATTMVDDAGGRPTVSVIVEGLGQSDLRTRTAIDALPQAVALAFDPYASGTPGLAAAAHAAGHEVLVTLPMELDTADADAGPQAMGVGLSPEENADRLSWALDRARGYVGVLTPTDAELTGDEAGMAPIIASLRRQGLMVVTGDPEDSAGVFPADLPQAAVDQRIELPDDTGRYDASFEAAEAAARDDGHVVLMVEPYPAAIRAVATWLDGLPGKGLAIVPVTTTATGRQAAAGP